ncbi:VPS10 domain-containing protein [Marinirhabdus gelatinilytica]|uniref:Sortilin (Neurotensin receptor 3) n=1 Tax=Marinirhabdus gelatinilytica TaxID=1703343 RepID=A0A370QA30_9FLAO|nr:glycosyl hydrolase [Marinirhabdus gelatinilytica]RDK85235.1 sortilin (neurotensin receptor 3) [Marinirhabdus gelatinilytica]
MKIRYTLIALVVFSFIFSAETNAQRKKNQKNTTTSASILDSVINGLEFRSIGPAFMSGRISDIEIHPYNENIWYVAVGSGGVWKTVNSGTTWTPIFDDQPSYSIGTVTLDPQNPNIVWVGSGEDSGGRHVGYGDGVYKSMDGGTTWKNVGLKNSEHISRIIVHPEDSNTVWVTAQGPLWSKGGDRGIYKTTDGGATWNKTLGDDEWVGATDLELDPTNPDILYAATWQRHRTVAAYVGGGPGTGLYKSADGGDTWTELKTGLPDTWMGKIGIAISPQSPDVIYAAIEEERRTGGLYRSENGGQSWKKMSNTVSGGTGPHYYQELYASPHHEGFLYLMDNTLQISEDGGKTFYRMNRKNKHGDNHAIAFRESDPDYLIVGTDGGLYETFDHTKTWKYVENLPVTQFYKVAVDDAEPFYNVFGGTQDNSTEGGPSRTDNVHGVQNSDWRVILNWDGHQPATEPGNPNIMYAERQEGTLSRIDMKTGEVIDIQPQAGANEKTERFNWDAPILVSPHNPTTIYFASQRVWKSDNRGDDWTAISADLTKNEERITLPIMGKQQSWDAPWDVYAMSNYNTITSLAESPKQKGLLYAGTDDGSIQISENDGGSWRKVNVGNIPGVPSTAFVNDIKADMFDANTVYVVLDNHKYGDFTPYLLKSTDKGNTWTSLRSNLPDRTLLWRIVQDHVKPNLLFLASEFGIYVSVNGGKHWTKMKGGVPTISFRDLAIQRRENDLVGASFGRGFYILDDYTALREITEDALKNETAMLFPVRDAWWYIPKSHLSFDAGKGSQGDDHFVAPNPDFGAMFTYYLKESYQTSKAKRKAKEKDMQDTNIPFAGWEALEKEVLETEPQLVFTVTDTQGNVVRNLTAPAKKGIHRIAWDLRYPSLDAITLQQKKKDENASGLLAPPGSYSVTMYLNDNGNVTKLTDAERFEVKPLYESSIKTVPPQEASAFWRTFENTQRSSAQLNMGLDKSIRRAKAMQTALNRSRVQPGALNEKIMKVLEDLQQLNTELNGNYARNEIGEKGNPTLGDRMFAIYRGIERSTYGPTSSHKQQLQIVQQQISNALAKLKVSQQALDVLYDQLQAAGAPYVEH